MLAAGVCEKSVMTDSAGESSVTREGATARATPRLAADISGDQRNGMYSRNMSNYFGKSAVEGVLPGTHVCGNGPEGRSQSARCDFRWKRFAPLAAKKITGKLGERVLVDLSLEIDYRVEGYPI